MVYIIVKKSARELRERAAESAPRAYRGRLAGYARGHEEADRLMGELGRDNPDAIVLTDDGGQAEREIRQRVLKSAGLEGEE